MPWDEKDFPASMKNMDPLLRKKAIQIANALESEGYEDGRSIPIAHAQAHEWYDHATEQEKHDFDNEPYPSKSDKHDSNSKTDLLDNDVKIFYEDDVWKVQSVGATRAAQTFERKIGRAHV